MRKTTAFLPILAGLLVASLITLGSSGAATGSQTWSGSYDWTNGGSDELKAEFTPDGDGQWKVVFRFRFNGKNNSWRGTAKGQLEDGSELRGTATWRSRRWTWTAAIDQGVMSGQHTEIQGDDRTLRTGTFEISR